MSFLVNNHVVKPINTNPIVKLAERHLLLEWKNMKNDYWQMILSNCSNNVDLEILMCQKEEMNATACEFYGTQNVGNHNNQARVDILTKSKVSYEG